MFAEGALVVEPDETAVAAALNRTLNEPKLATDLRWKGLERAKAFSWVRAATETLAVLEREALGLSVSPDDAYVVWTQPGRTGTDLMLVENFR